MDLFLTSPWPYLATAFFATLAGGYIWTQPRRPGTRYFTWLVGFWFIWGLAAALHNVVSSQLARYTMWSVESVASQLVSLAQFLVVLDYTGHEKWLARRSLYLLFLPLLPLVLLTIFRPDLISSIEVHSGFTVFVGTDLVRLPYYGYTLLLVLATFGVLLDCLLRAPAFRVPVTLLLVGRAIPAIAYAAPFMLRLPVSPIQASVLFIGISILIYLVALYSFRLLRVSPVARDAVIEHVSYALIVLDTENRLVDFNAAAQRLPGLPGRLALRRAADRALGGWWERIAPLVGQEQAAQDVSVPTGQGKRIYHIASLPLTQSTGRRIGQALIAEDVTEERRAQLKQIQAELRESEIIQRLIFDNASDGIAIYEEYPDRRERRLLECNERYAELSGRTKEELLEIGETRQVQKSLAPVSYAKPRLGLADAQSEGFFSWVRPDGKENIIEYKSKTIRLSGRLLSIGLDRDVTERMQAEAQILAQRWAQATLEEREQLAHELHDGISQSLAFLNVQAQAANLFLQSEQADEARASLDRLVEIAREMQGDVRELIGNLLAVSLPSEGFCATLRQVTSQFERQNGIPVRLEINDPAASLSDPASLPAPAGVQLIRIVQEALANVRKHAGERCQVSVQLEINDGNLRLEVVDNGIGFPMRQGDSPGDPGYPQAGGGATSQHYGLQVMRQRAARIGGQLSVHSAPGMGTRVEVCVPVNRETEGLI